MLLLLVLVKARGTKTHGQEGLLVDPGLRLDVG